MVFVGDGASALDEVRKAPFDVVVSDMRMPHMDGAELLAHIHGESPATVRIVLSGHADRAAIMRALPASHQLLAKPCDPNTLRGAIERGMLLPDRAVREVIGKLDKLPSPPAIHEALTHALASTAASLDDITKIIERDPAFSAKVLQLVNSAYFGRGQVTSSIPRAVVELGIDQLRQVAASVFSTSPTVAFPGWSLELVRSESEKVAQVSRSLVTGHRADEAFASGLLHDVGQIALALGMPETYREVWRRAQLGEALVAVERELVGASHAEVGACLLQIWGLPPAIVDPIRFHHDPAGASESAIDIGTAVHVADRQVAWSGVARRSA
jgi:HD-like signal output (HDOD) protein